MDKNKKTYSQIGQDGWILSLFPEGYKGFFLDVGCYLPDFINNTLMLERNGWRGLAFDIVDYSRQWQERKTPFICTDVLKCNFKSYGIPQVVDYLSLDVDFPAGIMYQMMDKLLKLGYEFKAITIEHNLYLGKEYDEKERQPQRELLTSCGYILAESDLMADDGLNNPFEDWWINPKYLKV